MIRHLLSSAIIVLSAVLLSGCSPAMSPTPVPVPTAEITLSPTESLMPIPPPEPSPTATGFAHDAATATPAPVEEMGIPQVEGLITVVEDGKIVYRAEAGNRFGLEEGTVAGHVTSFGVAEDINSSEAATAEGEKRGGIILHPTIVKTLFLQANTPEALARGEWKIPLPLVGAEGYTIMEVNHGSIKTIEVRGIPEGILGSLRIVSPYPEVEGAFRFSKRSTRGEVYHGVSLQPALSVVPEKGINWSISINYEEGNTPLQNYKQGIEYDSLMVSAISGNLPAPPYARGIQLSITAGSLEGPRDVCLANLLEVGGYVVSIME